MNKTSALIANSRKQPCRLSYMLMGFLLIFAVGNCYYLELLSFIQRVHINSTPSLTKFNRVQIEDTNVFHNRSKWDKCRKLCPFSSLFLTRTVEFNSKHLIRHFPEFICPQNFRNLADWTYEWSNQFNEYIQSSTTNGNRIASCLPNGSIIYVRQWSIDRFFTQVYPHLINRFVLITGEGDNSAPTHLEILDAPDSKIIHWFGQNGQYSPSKTNKFTHIPIGNRFPLYILH